MRSRREDKSKQWSPDYSTEGTMDFSINGYVQSIEENTKIEADYVKFIIDNPFCEGNFNSITVEVPWKGFPQLELGDHVNMFGVIRSWWNKDIGRVIYSFHAQQIQVVEDEAPKGRRGVLRDSK